MNLNLYPPRKKQLFRQLRGALIANDISNDDLGRLLNRAASHVSRCLNGHAQFTLAEQYIIMEAIREKPENMHKIFPKDGIDKDFKEDRQYATEIPAEKESVEELQLLSPVNVGKIGNRDVFITISYR